MVGCLRLLFFLATGAARQGLSDQITQALPPPTGKNGYEEYAEAAKLVAKATFGPYEFVYGTLTPEPAMDPDEDPGIRALRARLRGMNFLDIKREEVETFSRALELVRAGSLKPVYDPRKEMTPETTYPEMARFKQLSRLFVSESYVRFADGDATGGTRSMMDGLAFNYHISGGNVISTLVGVAGSAIVFRAFEPRLPMLGVPQCEEIESTVNRILAAPMGLKAGLEVERVANMKTAEKALTSMKSVQELSSMLTGDGASTIPRDVKSALAGAQPSDFARWGMEASDELNEMYKDLEGRLNSPESQWFTADDDWNLIKSQHGAVASAVADIMSPTWVQVFAAAARQRTQLRLLALHAKVIEYKWHHNRLPERLSDAVASGDLADPLAAREFGYAKKGDGYRLWSFGAKATGEIELYYRPPAATPDPSPHP